MGSLIISSLLVVFFVYILFCSYKYLVYRKVKIITLKFMTSCMLLILLTMAFCDDIFLHEKRYPYNESRVFSSSNSSILEEDVPQQVKKVTAYFDNTNPPRGSVTNLIVTGPPGGKVTAICHYKEHGTPYIMDLQKNGQVVIPIRVESNVDAGYVVVVDITVSYGGRNYTINSVFIPR